MYVAITRARKRLYLCYAQTRMLHGQTRYNVASRFLDEIPAEVVKWLTPRGAAASRRQRLAAEPLARDQGAEGGGRRAVPHRPGVVHPKFGQGVIVNAEGSGTDARCRSISAGRE